MIGGGPGADTIRASDGERDRIRCGPGKDKVFADRKDKLGTRLLERGATGRADSVL